MAEHEDVEDSGEDSDEPEPGTGSFATGAPSLVAPGGLGISPLLFEPDESTPLEEREPEDTIPPAPLWAMKSRAHGRQAPLGDPGSIRAGIGGGHEAIYVIDDGAIHCMVGRRVGASPDGCVYCLVARISLGRGQDLVEGEVPSEDAFSDARDIALCGVFSDPRASNVILVQHYRHLADVPAEYLPPSPFIEFT